MKSLIRKIVKRILPQSFILWIKRKILNKRVKQVQYNHDQALKKIRRKEKIKVAFFLIHSSIWKYDGVYKLMDQDDRFDPVVIICPYIIYGRDTMLADMRSAIEFCQQNGYAIVATYNEANDTWLDVKKEIQPDIVFFTNPHKLTRDEYYITNFEDVLTCYVPYGIMLANIQQSQYDQLFHNILWKAFYETSIHKNMAEKYARNKGENVVITGYPLFDDFESGKHLYVEGKWKIKDKKMKRIIWAPHHTIEENNKQLGYSCFLSHAKAMLGIAEKYKDTIQITFKPHPILRPKLYKDPDWGIEKTNEYYQKWVYLENGQLNEGDYVDLFLTSDGMILDSISFISEYLYIENPILFTVRDESIEHKFNEFGKLAFRQLYKAYTIEDIEWYIKDVVLGGEDMMLQNRRNFKKNYLAPPNGLTASQNIYNHIINELQ